MNIEKNLLILLNLTGLSPVKARAIAENFLDIDTLLKAKEDALVSVSGADRVIARRILDFDKTKLEEELELIAELKANVITVYDSEYPENLKNIYDPPLVLYVSGKIRPADNIAIAIVGSRQATHYGVSMAEKFAYELSVMGVVVASGMARGVDSAAHRGAIKAKGRTLAVLGSGLARLYPPENKKLAQEISEHGAVLSEFPMRTPPNPYNFPRRNRVISGLSLGVVVVEAKQRSGALITANYALEQGRDVFAVPGRADSPSSRGTNELIKEGARMCMSAQDVLDELNIRHGIAETFVELKSNIALGADEEKVYDIISNEPMHIDSIIDHSSLPSQKVSGAIVGLLIKKLVKELPGKYYVK